MALASESESESPSLRIKWESNVLGEHVPIYRTSEIVGFAPYHGDRICQDRAGRWRPRHEYDRDSCCYWCSRRMIF